MIAAAIFTAASLILGAACLYARGPWLKAIAYSILVASTAGLWYTALGVPRPVLVSSPRGDIVAYVMDEPRNIYLWIAPPGSRQPTAYRIPWHKQTAVRLAVEMTKARKQGSALRVGPANAPQRGRAAESSNSGGVLRFYPAPPAALPPKAPK